MMTRFSPGGVASGATPGTPGAVYECNPQTVRAFRLQTDYAIPPACRAGSAGPVSGAHLARPRGRPRRG